MSYCEFVTFHWYPGSAVFLNFNGVSLFCNVHVVLLSSFVIIFLMKRELVDLLNLCTCGRWLSVLSVSCSCFSCVICIILAKTKVTPANGYIMFWHKIKKKMCNPIDIVVQVDPKRSKQRQTSLFCNNKIHSGRY